jgi:glycogen operon protein
MIIYEAHVRGFTAHPSAKVAHPGTYLGFVEKIPYLQALGVTSIELLPVQEHHIRGELVQKGLNEYWGYNTIGFFAPESSYASDPSPGSQVREFKTLVRELHRAGMEVILDVVYNHTGEENELGPTLCFRGIDNLSYYALEGPVDHPKRFYRDVTGCRNTLDIEKPAVLRLVLDSLRYWVQEMHVDGFRFDLAPVLGYREGFFSSEGTFFKAIKKDPELSGIKLIAEPWDIANRETGGFPSGWMEWNDSFRDTLRHYLRGDSGQVAGFATRFSGSEDIFGGSGRSACSSINFITAHDGFTLYDLYSYEKKHNEANGEHNRDGSDNNSSWNCGGEGKTDNREVLALRRRMARNSLLLLLCSRGIPMLLSGDEVLRTQGGNNNAYCQDNETSWFPWKLVERNGDMLAFCRSLIELRRKTDLFRSCAFYSGQRDETAAIPDMAWYAEDLTSPVWEDNDNRLLCCELRLSERDCTLMHEGFSLYMIFNMGDQKRVVSIPKHEGLSWHLLYDTGNDEGSLHPWQEIGTKPVSLHRYDSRPHTVVVLVSVKTA